VWGGRKQSETSAGPRMTANAERKTVVQAEKEDTTAARTSTRTLVRVEMSLQSTDPCVAAQRDKSVNLGIQMACANDEKIAQSVKAQQA
jgi:hypothetical protein